MNRTDTDFTLEEQTEIVTSVVRVDEEEIPGRFHVVSIIVQHGINKIPSATIVLMDGEPSKKDFEASSSGQFTPGKKIEIDLGYKNKNKLVFKGIIISNTQNVNSNCAELNLVCKHETEKMTVNKRNAHFKKQITAAEIAEELLKKNGFDNPTTEVEPIDLKHEQVAQYNVTDWDFMIARLDISCLICLINNGKIKIKKLKLTDPPKNDSGKMLKLIYGDNILEFTADLDSRTRSDSVKTMSWDFKTQTVVTEENDAPAIKDNEESKTENVSKEFAINTAARLKPEEQKSIATAKKLRQDLSKIKGKIKYFGSCEAFPGDFIEIEGLGKKFSGHAFVSELQHEYADGLWTTEATLGWSEKFFIEETNPGHAASASGQPSALQGLQIGVVTNIEDDDGEYRVQVKLPMVDNNADGMHARVAAVDAGKNRGSFFRPELDDEVVLGFINDDPSNPVILGMMHSSAKPAPLEPEKKNDKKGYVSRAAIKLIFDDGEKTIRIETPGNRVFEMNDNAGTIIIQDGGGNKIVMEQSGISMEAAKDIKIKAGASLSLAAPKISIKADAKLEAEGSAATNIKSGGVTEIKGSLVKIN